MNDDSGVSAGEERSLLEDLELGRPRMLLLVCAAALAPGVVLLNAAFGLRSEVSAISGLYAVVLMVALTRAARWARRLERGVDEMHKQSRVARLALEKRDELERELRHLAFHDHLTGLPNRAFFYEELTAALARAKRSRSALAVLMIDVDGFKSINDRFGHGMGDEVLRSVAARAKRCLRASDQAGRLGGDEFVLLLESVDDVLQTIVVVDRLRHAMREPVSLRGIEITVGVSVGIALSTEDTHCDELMRRADLAMYEAKLNRRGAYHRDALDAVFWDPSMIEPPAQFTSERSLRIDA